MDLGDRSVLLLFLFYASCDVHATGSSALELIEDVMADLFQAVDSRVNAAVGRGLGGCASQDVYDYLQGLQEGLGLKKVQALWPHLFLFALDASLASKTDCFLAASACVLQTEQAMVCIL